MIIELLSIAAPNRKRLEIGKALASLVGAIELQPGCLSCHLSQVWPMQDELQIAARWDTHENLLGHLRSEVYKKLLLLMEFSTTPPVLEFCGSRISWLGLGGDRSLRSKLSRQ